MDLKQWVMGWGLAGVVALGGCASSEPQVRPSKQPDEFRAPPENDPRYSNPVEYPKDLLEQDMLLKKSKETGKGMGGGGMGSRGMVGSGMGGPGR